MAQQIVSYFLLASLLTCNNGMNFGDYPDGAKEICLNYPFNFRFPHTFKISGDRVFVGVNASIIEFDLQGNPKMKMTIPGEVAEAGFVNDFSPTGGKQFYVTVYEKLYEVSEKKFKLIASSFGTQIRRSGSKYLVTFFQEYDSINANITNRVRIFDTSTMRLFTYPFVGDLGTYNLEVLDDEFGLVAADKCFFLFPMDTSNTFSKRPVEENLERVSFLGLHDRHYVFLAHNVGTKQDHVYFYSKDMLFVAEAVIDFQFYDLTKAVRDDSEFLMEYPSGNIYTFDNAQKTIYLMRSENGKVCIYDIQHRLKFLRGKLTAG